MLDISAIRKGIEIPEKTLFFNSAGASLVDSQTHKTVLQHLDLERQVGGYKAEDVILDRLESCYAVAATTFGVLPDQVAFTHDATDGYIRALSSIPFVAGDCIVTSENDYASNQIQFLSLHKRQGVDIVRIGSTAEGDLDLDQLHTALKNRHPKLVAITHVPTNSGLVQPVKEVGAIIRQFDTMFLLDACQSAGQLVVNAEEIGCDFLTTTGRKFLRGPRGTGLLIVSRKMLEMGLSPLYPDGRSATWIDEDMYNIATGARRFETWESPVAMKLGLGKALELYQDLNPEAIAQRNMLLHQRLRSQLQSIPDVEVFDRGTNLCCIVTFRKGAFSLTEMAAHLEEHHVVFSISTREWGLIDYAQKEVDGTIRLSPHYFNTEDEIDRLCEVIETL